MELTSTTTVNKPPQEVYDFWHRLENLATFMAHLDDVRVTGPSSSHWAASAPFDTVVEWEAVTTGDVAIKARTRAASKVFKDISGPFQRTSSSVLAL